MRQSLLLCLDFRFSLEELVLSWGRHVVFPLFFHEFLNEGLFPAGFYLFLWLVRFRPRITGVVVHSWPRHFPMNFSIILEVVSSFGHLALLFLLILVLILEGGLVLGLHLVPLNAVIIDAVRATVHVIDPYHIVKTNKL